MVQIGLSHANIKAHPTGQVLHIEELAVVHYLVSEEIRLMLKDHDLGISQFLLKMKT